jgi:hypothetical protein
VGMGIDHLEDERVILKWILKVRHSSVSMMAWLWAVQPEFDSWQGQGLFLLATASGPALASIQLVLGPLPRAQATGT